MDECLYEHIHDKIDTLGRFIRAIKEYMKSMNDELYDMRIPFDVLEGVDLLQEIRIMAIKCACEHTNFESNNPQFAEADSDSLVCIKETRKALYAIEHASVYNPDDNITADIIDDWCRQLHPLMVKQIRYLTKVWETHRDVPAEWP